MRRILFDLTFVLLLAFTAAAFPRSAVKAESSVTAYDLIAMVNSIRTGSYGLPALIEDATLDAEAQWTAEEMAAIGAHDHLKYLGYADASVRAAGLGFGGGKTVFVTENWYGGYTATISDIQIGWSDEQHMYPMTKAQYTYVGAGVATASDGMTYYILQAGSISGEVAAATSSVNVTTDTSAGTEAAVTSNWLSPVYTTTPSADGMIYHVVKANQTLFYIALAYGVTVDSLVELNNLDSADDIYEGQTLTINFAPLATATITPTPTSIYPTRTPTNTPIPATPTPAMTATPTPRPSIFAAMPKFDRGILGLLLVVLSGLGLLIVVFINFFKPTKKPAKEPAQPVAAEPVKAPAPAPKKSTTSGSVKKPSGDAAKKPLSKTGKTTESKTNPKTTKK
jgi:LysM repeat protein/uncharacterized protein YkwD